MTLFLNGEELTFKHLTAMGLVVVIIVATYLQVLFMADMKTHTCTMSLHQ